MCASAESSRTRSMTLFARPELGFIIGSASICNKGCKPRRLRIRESLQSAGGLSWRRNTGLWLHGADGLSLPRGAWGGGATFVSRQNAGAASLSGFARILCVFCIPDDFAGRPGRFCGERVRVAFHVLRQSPLPAPPAKG